MTERLGFIHIPKTGGTSLVQLLLRSYTPSDFRNTNVYEIANFPDLINNTAVVAGHIPHFLYRREREIRRLFTIIRHPVERAISNMRYILSEPGHYAHAYVAAKRLTLADFYSHPVLRIEITNYQTKMLGWDDPVQFSWPASHDELNRLMRARFETFSTARPDARTLDAAITRLTTDIQFAVLEVPRSISALARLATKGAVAEFPRTNTTEPGAYEATEQDLDAIHVHNKLDLVLYQFAAAAWRQSP